MELLLILLFFAFLFVLHANVQHDLRARVDAERAIALQRDTRNPYFDPLPLPQQPLPQQPLLLTHEPKDQNQ